MIFDRGFRLHAALSRHIPGVQSSAQQLFTEYGQGAAAVSMVTKSGGNQIHGNLFEYTRSSIFGARNYFSTYTVYPHKPVALRPPGEEDRGKAAEAFSPSSLFSYALCLDGLNSLRENPVSWKVTASAVL